MSGRLAGIAIGPAVLLLAACQGTPELAAALRAAKVDGYPIDYRDYDWSLNSEAAQ